MGKAKLALTDVVVESGRVRERTSVREVDTGKAPAWEPRFLELRAKGLGYAECAEVLNKEGFSGKQGGMLTAHHCSNRMQYIKMLLNQQALRESIKRKVSR